MMTIIVHARDAARHAAGRVAAADIRVWTVLALLACSALFWASARNATVTVDGVRYHFLDDDQMISMRYARNLAEGHGLVWNRHGERVEGYTNFGWTLVMAAVHGVGASDATAALWVRGVNWLLAGLTLVLMARLLTRLGLDRSVAAGAALMTLALSWDLLFWAINGFETTLLTVMFLWALLRAIDDASLGVISARTCLLAGMLPVVRADAFDLTAAVVLTAFALGARRRWWLAVLAGVPLALHLGFRLNYYGDLLPNTYYLKVAGRHGLFIRGLGNIKGFVAAYTVVTVLAAAVAAFGVDRRSRVMALLVVLGFARLVVVGPDIFGGFRFLAPYLPVLLIASVAGIERVAAGTSSATLTMAALLLLTTTFSAGVNGAASFRALISGNGGPAVNTVAGVLLERHTRPGARVAVVAAGCLPYFSRRAAIDMLGKSDRHVARLPEATGGATGHNRFDIDWSLRDRPDIVAPFGPLELTTEADAILKAGRSDPERDHGAALALNRTFAREYHEHTAPVRYLHERNALFVHERSPEIGGLAAWHEPSVHRP